MEQRISAFLRIIYRFHRKKFLIAGGIYWFEEKELLERVRNYILKNSDQFSKLISDKKFVEKYGEIKGDKNKRLPKEFVEFEKVQPLIANKQFYWAATFDPNSLLKNDFTNVLLDHFHAAKALQDFFKSALISYELATCYFAASNIMRNFILTFCGSNFPRP